MAEIKNVEDCEFIFALSNGFDILREKNACIMVLDKAKGLYLVYPSFDLDRIKADRLVMHLCNFDLYTLSRNGKKYKYKELSDSEKRWVDSAIRNVKDVGDSDEFWKIKSKSDDATFRDLQAFGCSLNGLDVNLEKSKFVFFVGNSNLKLDEGSARIFSTKKEGLYCIYPSLKEYKGSDEKGLKEIILKLWEIDSNLCRGKSYTEMKKEEKSFCETLYKKL